MANINEVLNNLLSSGDVTLGNAISQLNQLLPPDQTITISSETDLSGDDITPRSKVFSEFDYNNDVVMTDQRLTEGLFYGTGSLSTFSEDSSQSTSSLNYYKQVQDSSNRDIFSIAIGDLNGSDEEKAMYKQMANMLLDDSSTTFEFNDSEIEKIGIVSIDRVILKERIDAGNWQLEINTTDFIDDSAATGSGDVSVAGEYYSIVAGTIAGGISNSTERGKVYLDQGVLVFDGDYLESIFSITTLANFYSNLSSFQARNERNLKEINYFVRLQNKDYNYSNNPTFYTASNGNIVYDHFVYNPKTYITTVGLYDNDNELMAVARISKPVEKSFDKETLLKVKLAY